MRRVAPVPALTETVIKRKDIGAQLSERWEADETLVDDVAAAIRRGLTAESWRWDKKTNQEVVQIDHRAQLEASKLIIAYSTGLPLQRSLAMAVNESGYGAMKDLLRDSPALLDSLEREVEKAKFKTRNVKQVVATETDPSELPAE